MVIRLLLKYAKPLIDILIVGAIVFAIVMVNPFNIFGGGLTLQNTTNNVSAIREIGQLVTAEYYGEAIATYDQSKLQLISEEDVSDKANSVFRDMKQYLLKAHLESIEETEEKAEKKKGFFSFKWLPWISSPKKEFKEQLDGLDPKQFTDDETLPNEVLAFYFNKSKVKPQSNKFKNLMWKLLQEVKSKSMSLNDVAFNEYMLLELPIKDGQIFSDFHYSQKKKDVENDIKTDLSMIGRGWVKAGIDFGTITDDNLVFDKDHGIVHLYGVYPKILAKDINPWFIPEKQIPGFQIIESRNANFHHAVRVKEYCINKLERMAKDAGILEQAEKQAKESIKSFIGLVTETEVKEVHFHNDTLTRITNDIMEDKFVSIEEGKVLDTLIEKQIEGIEKIDISSKNWFAKEKEKTLKQERLERILTRLKACVYLKRPYKYQRMASTIANITLDSILTQEGLKALGDKRWSAAKLLENRDSTDVDYRLEHRIWYGDSTLQFIGEYNEVLNQLEKRTLYRVKSFEDIEIPINEGLPTADSLTVKYFYVATYDSIIRYKKLEGYQTVNETFDSLRYQIKLPIDWKKKMYVKKGYFERSKISGLERIDSLDIKKLAKKLNEYLPEDDSIDATYISVIRNEEGNWQVEPSQSISKGDLKEDTKAVVNHVLNYYLQESERFGWFTKSSKKAKSLLTNENIQTKADNVKQWLDENINL